MNPVNTVVLSLVSFIILFHACPNEACLNKIRTLIRDKGKDEKPATLHPDEASLIKYSHSQTQAPLYIEISPNADKKSIRIRELDHPPKAMSQVAGDDLKEKSKESTSESDKPEERSETKEEQAVKTSSQEVTTNGEGVEEEEVLSPEDENIRREWGGNCTQMDWDRCNKIRRVFVKDVIHTPFQRKSLDLNCLHEPILCLRNGWTANRCHILCMAQCNPTLFFDWDGTVDFEGPCRYKK